MWGCSSKFAIKAKDRHFSVGFDEELSQFDALLQTSWKAAEEKGVLRYKLPDLRTKILPGRIGYVVQLNTMRGTQRRTPANITCLSQPFNRDLFNFTKVKPDEVLFEVVEKLNDSSLTAEEKHYLLVNVSPLEFCNVLLVPQLHSCLCQVISVISLTLVIRLILASSQWAFRIVFNSLCAFASVNHLHYHGYYVFHHLPCEKWPVLKVAGPCYELDSYPGKGFVFFLGESIEELASSVFKLTSYFHESNIAHNLMMTRGCGPDNCDSRLVLRIIVWPRKPSV
eukprot:m.69804 g.69804  ORF g.69804 m.69804 type:complete len:282 (+) comp35632_c0_seq1:20-865(+)